MEAFKLPENVSITFKNASLAKFCTVKHFHELKIDALPDLKIEVKISWLNKAILQDFQAILQDFQAIFQDF